MSTVRERVPPTPEERSRLEHPQQLDLAVGRHLPDLVEEQRAAVGQLDQPGLGARAGERAPLVAEQLALEQPLGQRAAVDARRTAARRAAIRSWMARATSSLPVPLSPRMSTAASVGATRSIRRSISCIFGLAVTIPRDGR